MIRYTIVCHVCVELGREQTIHLMRHPLAKACREHLKVGRLRRDYQKQIEKRCAYARAYYERHRANAVAWQRAYNERHRDEINRKMREHRARKRAA